MSPSGLFLGKDKKMDQGKQNQVNMSNRCTIFSEILIRLFSVVFFKKHVSRNRVPLSEL